MRIFYIGKFGLPHNTENYVAYALKQLGVAVAKQQFSPRLTTSELMAGIHEHQADVVLLSKPSHPCFSDVIRYCRRENILTVTWLWDLYWGYRRGRPVQFAADLVFTTDGGHDNRWQEHGINHRVLRQGIHEPEHQAHPVDVQQPLVFIGCRNCNPHRRLLVRRLQKTFGSQIRWHDSLRGLDLNRELARTAIVIGDSYPVKNYWSNRIYEILGRGGFLLHPKTVGLDQEFIDGKHYVAYDGLDDLRAKVHYYLDHDDDRERIREQGFEHMKKYTYTERCRKLIEMISLYFPVEKE